MFHGYSAYQPLMIGLRLLIFILIAIVVDFYLSRSCRILTADFKLALIKKGGPRLHLALSGLFVLFVLSFAPFLSSICRNYHLHFFIMIINTVFLTIYIPKFIMLFFQLLHDFIIIILWFTDRYSKRKIISAYIRNKFYLKLGFVFSFLIFIIIFSGIFIFRYQYKIEQYKIESEQIPISFDGYKIVQISDLHLGSFNNFYALKRLVSQINKLNPDLLVITGDIINFHPSEITPFQSILNNLKAADGKYAITGNHDYGDYLSCLEKQEKLFLIKQLEDNLNKINIKLLRNRHEFIKRNQDSFMLAGTENWSVRPYKCYGNLAKTLGENNNYPFMILLSHDPRHWQYQIKDSLNILLTLSGHSHGGQFGIYTHFFKWSPIEKIIRYWGGQYSENDNYLIVNKGIGVIGFLGRIGIRPEISLINLKSTINTISPVKKP